MKLLTRHADPAQGESHEPDDLALLHRAGAWSWSARLTCQVCLTINALIILPLTEGLSEPLALAQELGPPILLLNAACTFALNLSSTWLIGKASGLVLTLAGVIKDVLLVGGSVVLLGSPITSLQIVGCALDLRRLR